MLMVDKAALLPSDKRTQMTLRARVEHLVCKDSQAALV